MFTAERDLSSNEALVIAHAMAKVSACDGVDDREKELIEAFLKDVGSDKSFDELVKEDFDASAAAKDLDTELRQMLMEGAWMVAFADGFRVGTREGKK